MYANDDDELDERVLSESDDELGCVAIKDESPKKYVRQERALVSQVEKKVDWIIDSGCSHHMTTDMNKFVEFNSCHGGIFRVGNNTT